MKILMLMGGGDIGGAKTHILSLACKLSKNYDFKLVSFRHGDFPNEAKALGIDVEIIPSNNVFIARKELKDLILKFKPNVIHSHGTRANLMSVLTKNVADVPIITTVHSDYKLDYLGSPVRQYTFGVVNAISLRHMDHYIAVADKMQSTLISRKFNPNKISKIYNGIDYDAPRKNADKFKYFADFGIEINENDILCGIAARLSEVKDIPTLLKGFKISLETNKNLKLMIAGTGEDKEKLEKMAKDLKIDQNVFFLGWISDIHSFFSSIDINILSSISETFPYTISEGIHENCATISSDVGGVNKIIDSGVNGFIFDVGDFKELAKCISILANDREKINHFAKLSFENASKNFSLENTYQTQLNIYKDCIKSYNLQKEKFHQITICGAYGKGNAGDDAILRAIVSEMRQIDPNVPLCVMSRSPLNTKLDYLTDSVFTFHVLKFAKHFRKSKLYINGGGSLIQDITSSRSLYFYLFTLGIAKILGSKVMMYGCGIGPVNRPFNKKLATKVINKYVDVITLRDEISREELARMGVCKPKILVSADPTMSITPNCDDAIDKAFEQAGIPKGKKYLGIGLRNWKDFDSVSKEIAASIDYAYEKHGLIPVFLPIEYPSDLNPSKKVSNFLKSPHYIIKTRQSTETTIGLFSKMDMVLGIRLHSLIFSAGNGVPVVGLSYDIKVDGFLKFIESDACITLKDVKAENLNPLIDMALTDTYKEKVLSVSNRLKEHERQNVEQATKLISEVL